MNSLIKKILIGMAGAALSTQAVAMPFSSFDPRSFAMGGTGVAAGTSANAVFFNPALLATAREEEDFSFDLLGGARAADPKEMVDAVDNFSAADPITAFDNAVQAYIATPSAGNAAVVTSTGTQLINSLQTLSAKAVQLEADAGLVVGIPGKSLGMSFFANAYLVGGTVADVTNADLTAIQTVIDDVNVPQVPTNPVSSLTSSVSVRGALVTEYGVAFARQFDALGGIAIGITPKVVSVESVDFRFVGSAIDNATVDLDQGKKSETDTNIDVGVAKDYGNGWRVGLVAKNLISQDYTTVLGNTLKIEPQIRAGVVKQNEWITLAADLDISENDPAGFDNKSQYLALGAELDIFDTAQLRLGIRHNLSDLPADFESDTVTAGLGFSPFGVHLDLAAAGNADEVGVALQLGFRF